MSIISQCLCFLCGQHHSIWEKMRGPIGNFSGYLTKLLDHSFHQCPHFSVLAAHQLRAAIHSASYDPETSKCAWPASQFFFVFTHVISEPLLTWGFQEPTAGCVCSRPSRDTPHSYLIFTRSGSSSPLRSGGVAHSRLRNSWQFFLVERLSLHVSDMKSAYMFGRVTAHYNHTASLGCL